MQPIRVQEKDYWRSQIRRLFNERSCEVNNIYAKQLNDKVDKSLPQFRKSIGVDKLLVALEGQIADYQNFRDSYKTTLRNKHEEMVQTATKIEQACQGFVESSANDSIGRLDISDIRHDETVNIYKFNTWSENLCRSWAEQDDIRKGNKLKMFLNGLNKLEDMAYSRLEEGYSLADAKDEIFKIYSKAGIQVPTLPEHVELPVLLEHDSP